MALDVPRLDQALRIAGLIVTSATLLLACVVTWLVVAPPQ